MTGPSLDGLPDDLARVLRDQSIIVPQDSAVFDLIAKWAKAQSTTLSAGQTPPQPAAQTGPSLDLAPDVGREATVFLDADAHEPVVLPLGPRDRDDLVAMFPRVFPDTVWIVSAWSLHVALYGLQQGTPEAIKRALSLIGRDSDVEVDSETLLPLPVNAPDGWEARS